MRTRVPSSRLVLIALFAGFVLLAGGCRSSARKKVVPSPPPAPQPATPEQVQAVRQAYLQSYPTSRVGVVVAARPPDKLVAVDQVPLHDVQVNDVVIFVDSAQKVLADGVIVAMYPDTGHVHVRYTPAAGGRAPRPGDIMVKM